MSFGVTPAKWSGTMWKIAGRFTLPSVRAAAPSNGMSKPRFSWIFCMMLMFLLFCFMSFFKIFAVFGAFHLPLILGLSSAYLPLKGCSKKMCQLLRIHKKRAKLQNYFEIYKFICTFAENL
jgi:hypothetical protein